MRALALSRRCREWTSSVLFASMVLGGCGYTSTYVAPVDGRARAVWRNDKVVVEASGAPLTDACSGAIEALTLSSGMGLAEPQAPPGGYWVPRFYGPPILVARPGLVPLLPLRPLFVPPIALGHRSIGLRGGLSPGLHLAVGRGGPGGRRVGGGAGKGAGMVLVVLAVAALLVLPAIDIGLALADPEDAPESALAIDQVNAWNDLVRWAGSPCDWASAGPVP